MFASGTFCHGFVSFCVLSLATVRLVAADPEPAPTGPIAPTPAQPGGFTGPQTSPPAVPNGSPSQTTLYWPQSFYQKDVNHERPEYLKYDPQAPFPSGYRLQTYIPRGYIIWGSITFGVGYGVGVISATSHQDKDFQANWLFLPVLGPFIGMATQRDTCTRGTAPPQCGRDPDTLVVLAILGGMQAVGGGLFIYGATHPRQRLVRVDTPTFVIAPSSLGLLGYGLTAAGVF